ncbi:Sapep family Mn(2+)-dependent dipeptidase [Ihubacter sp. mB4P-1]|uniref:Sapep family Mn(2+)-dependent dipeptidase n=1 Tax=Ihubacter sp. mB4P-1 TaxID=3242370 RepID=UPI00137B7B7E
MKAEEFITKHREDMIADIKAFAAIPSILDEETMAPGRPFGEKAADALSWVLEKGKSLGMDVKNFDGYAGEMTVGTGGRLIGILGHADVVAPGEGWDTEPFEIQEIDGKLYGRGTMDDKGPIVSCLYAVKYLMEENLIPKDTAIRFIVGCDEEEEWRCIEHYGAKADRMPDCAIVPDGNFPLIHCEKGLMDVDFSYAVHGKADCKITVEALHGGAAKNVVPGKAYCNLRCPDAETAAALAAALNAFEQVSATQEESGVSVIVSGKSTHAMSPEKGLNAISQLMQTLGEVGKTFDIEPVYRTYNQYIGMHYYGENFGLQFEDAASGKLTFNVGTIELKDGKLVFGVSVRYPATVEKEKIFAAAEETCRQAGMEMHVTSHMNGLYVDADSDFIGVLMEAYQKVSGDCESRPMAIGGATYARTIPNAVAFGPLFPYEEELAHEANEYLDLDSLDKMTLIYIEALKGLLAMEA